MGRIPVLTTFRTGDEVQDRNFDHIKQTLNPVLRNPLFASQDFRWMEVAPTTASGLPTFELQYRTQETWATILTLTSAGQIVQPAWIAPTLLNSWVNFGAGAQPAGYMKDSQGFVHLRGGVKNGSAAAAVIFTLPAGYRPNIDSFFSGVGNTAWARVKVSATGDVQADTGGSTTLQVIDGLSFDTR